MRAHEHARAGGWRPRHDGTQSPGRHPASRHHANAGLGIELLAPGNSGRPHCPRSRHVEHLILRGLLCLPCRLGAGGATRCPHGGQSRLIGPSRVSARILEASLMKRFHPMVSARLSVALHPLGVVVLGAFGAGTASAVFTVLHGAGSGILTIARGTVPSAMLGPEKLRLPVGAARRALPSHDGGRAIAFRRSH